MNAEVYVIFVLGLILRLLFSFINPPFTGNDEPAHLRYAQHILAEKRLPNANLYRDEPLTGNEYFQPPLYYTISSFLIAPEPKPLTQMTVLRFLNVFLWVVLFYFSYLSLKRLGLDKTSSLLGLSLLSLLPTFIFLSTTIGNDLLVITLGTITIYYLITLAVTGKTSYTNLLILSILSSLSILAKLTGFSLVFGGLTLILLTEKSLFAKIKKSIFYLSSICIMVSWWFLYNFFTYKNFLGPIDLSTNTFTKVPFSLYKVYLVSRGSFFTFWAAYGPANQIRLPLLFYFVFFLLSLLAVLGVLTYLKKPKRNNLSLTKILFSIIASNVLLLLLFNIDQLQPLGRYLYVSLLPLAVFFGLGLKNILPKKLQTSFSLFLILFLLTANLLAIIIVKSSL